MGFQQSLHDMTRISIVTHDYVLSQTASASYASSSSSSSGSQQDQENIVLHTGQKLGMKHMLCNKLDEERSFEFF